MNRSFMLSSLVGGLLFVAAITRTSASSAPAFSLQTPAAAETLSAEELAARTTFAAVCSTCHDLATATMELRTRQEWNDIFDMMVSFGASATDAQFAQIRQYLSRRYGVVNVNTAPVEELQLVLDISPEVAQAIIDSRSSARFVTAEDLKNVPGLAVDRLERLRPKLRF